MAIQTTLGKAFEYACLKSIYNILSENQEVVIENNKGFIKAMELYNNTTAAEQLKLMEGAAAATRSILKLEPQLEHPLNNIPLHLSIQGDAKGSTGDVRDIVCLRRQNDWEIGISCKHNHAAVKHSRLSKKIDFGLSWFNIPCTEIYFNEINPLFDELEELKNKRVLWREIDKKEERFYIPLLNAFVKELVRLNEVHPNTIPEKLLNYLLGKNDFYKVIANDRKKYTIVQCFNIYGTLGANSGKAKPLANISKLTMPTRFYDISFKKGSKNTILVACDNGWTISMRIHSARSLVEPSLKFDVGLIGVPASLYSQSEPW